MARTIPHRELRNNSSAILRDVAAGETIRITNHGEVVAVLVPPSEADRVAPHIQPARIRGDGASYVRSGSTILCRKTRKAGLLPGLNLRSLDAIHVAAALRGGADSMIT